MFGIFKRKKDREPRISDHIQNALSQGITGLHIDIYIDNQILFQIQPARSFRGKGLTKEEAEGFIEVHFFNKNKTFTLKYHPVVKRLASTNEFIYYEEPKGIDVYIRAIGRNPEKMEQIIYKRLQEIYTDISPERISIEYFDY